MSDQPTPAVSATTTTVSQLKTFIEAVEFLSDQPDWIPNPRQWQKIRTMIMTLEDQVAVPGPRSAPMQLIPSQVIPTQSPSQLMALPQSSMVYGTPSQNAPFATGVPGQSVRTPNIDTSSGSYDSPFAL